MLRLKQQVALRAARLVGNAEQVTGIESFKMTTQSALRQLDVEAAPLWAVLRLWWLAHSIERYAYHTAKLLQLQETADDLRN
ncbi:hypothetical protein [Pseudomonas sp. BN102]|uniref:hypothetical protein n=1 Tax=Pseudomonas sp. BN102 TaxID=2567886 RepID=UPI00245850EB|nr:hypothetical protein [Pseudomonas sp. BN102]MDH4610314.1 hypothetical protein [Pseudomonas sp. BN102]